MTGFFAPTFILPLVLALFAVLLIALLRWLWNLTMPRIFGLPQIAFWEAFRLLLIAGILFGIWRI